MKKSILLVIVGVLTGYFIATVVGKTQKQIVRVDAVSLKKVELAKLREAIDLRAGPMSAGGHWRYETNSGVIALECPSDEMCNLEVPARVRENPKQWQMSSHIDVQAPKPVRGVVAAQAQPIQRAPETSGNSIYDQLDLKNGDTVTMINGEQMHSPETALSRLQEFVQKKDALREVTLLRHGQKLRINFVRNDEH